MVHEEVLTITYLKCVYVLTLVNLCISCLYFLCISGDRRERLSWRAEAAFGKKVLQTGGGWS